MGGEALISWILIAMFTVKLTAMDISVAAIVLISLCVRITGAQGNVNEYNNQIQY